MHYICYRNALYINIKVKLNQRVAIIQIWITSPLIQGKRVEKVFFEILVSKKKETQKKNFFFSLFSICLGDNKTGSSEKEKKASNGKIVSIGQDLQYAKLDKCKMSHQLKVLERKKERERERAHRRIKGKNRRVIHCHFNVLFLGCTGPPFINMTIVS